MKVAGIIAEYNPFHNGHLYQIRETRKLTNCDFVIVIMSGSFSQRGQAAICDKFTRARMALLNGADLVLELPVVFATASAERFSHYAVSSLDQTHLTDYLSFGSESGILRQLDEAATLLSNPDSGLDQLIRQYLKEGLSYPRAREKALLSFLKTEDVSLIQSPNNILGIEYLKALKKLKSQIRPVTIRRTGTGYHDPKPDRQIASATAIRHQLQHQLTDYMTCIPENTQNFLKGITPPDMNRLTGFIHYKLMFSSYDQLYTLWDIPKPLIHSLVKCCHPDMCYTDLIDAVTSKTYTKATVSRSLLRILLDIKSSDMQPILEKQRVPYLRVLGCKKEAACLLRALNDKSDVPVITSFARSFDTLDSNAHMLLQYETAATRLYHYILKNASLMKQDFTTGFRLTD